MNALIVPAIPSVLVTVSNEASALRDSLLERARKGTCISSPDSAGRAADLLKEIAGFTRDVKAQREQANAPVLQLQRALMKTQSDLIEDLEQEAKRIGALIATFKEAERREAEEAKRRAYEEELRIRREREEREAAEERRIQAELEAKRAEAARQQAELEAKAARATTDASRERLEREAALAKAAADAEAARIAKEAQEAAAQREFLDAKAIGRAHAEAQSAAPTSLSGIGGRRDVEFDVTDIHALYAAHPALVILAPNKAALKAFLKSLPEGGSIAGVKHWWTSKATVRLS